MDNQPDNQHQNSVSFLLEEYRRLGESFLRNEELGERRFNFFITLTTAVIAALAAIWKVPGGGFDRTVFFSGLVLVFVFGIVTLVRMVRRNLATHDYLRALGRIRGYFTEMHPETERGLSYPPYDDQPKREKKWKDIWSLGTGGLVEMLALVNSLVLAAIFMLLTRSPSGWIVVPLGLAGFAAAWIYQFVYVMYSYNKGKPRREKIRFPTPREVEATLIICSAEPELIAREIAGLSSIKHYRLLPQDSQEIHDRYFDTPERALESLRLGLRIREVGGMHLIALKGSSETSGWGSAERLEIEETWSENAVRRMARELRNRRIQLPPLPEDFSRVDPLDVMTRLGLKVIQDRETHRETRTIVFAGREKGTVLAELAIDSVAYHFGDRKIRHHEVEVEAKAEGGSEAIERVTKGLMGMYEATLRPWKYSKLATGKAIEQLLKEGALEEFLDNNNNLKPSAYDRIDDLLRRGSM